MRVIEKKIQNKHVFTSSSSSSSTQVVVPYHLTFTRFSVCFSYFLKNGLFVGSANQFLTSYSLSSLLFLIIIGLNNAIILTVKHTHLFPRTDQTFSTHRPDCPNFFFQGAKSNCMRSEVRVLKVIQTLVLLHMTVGGFREEEE